VLQPAQLSAVLAHERAHLAGRHHLLIVLTRVLAATFPAVPLFTRGPAEVARLAEMCADDVAVRRSGRHTLLTALLAMGTGTAVPAATGGTAVPAATTGGTAVTAGDTVLAATGGEVAARVQRLLEPPRRASRARYSLALSGVTLLLPLASALLAITA
jgi:Zn-dependent protease with chaperone function